MSIKFRIVPAIVLSSAVFAGGGFSASALDQVENVDGEVTLLSEPLVPEEIDFGIVVPEMTGISDDVREIIGQRVEQLLGRNNAAKGGAKSIFVIEPMMILGEESHTDGLVQDVATVSAELKLSAKHRYTGATYYSASVPLKVVGTRDALDMQKQLARAIKPSDACYVRFVRNARKNIAEYASAHPEVLVSPADTPPVPLIIIVNSASPQPIPGGQGAGQPAGESGPKCSEQSQPEITYSIPGWNAKLISCEYDPSTHRIFVTLSVCSEAEDHSGAYTSVSKAISPNGDSYSDFGVDSYRHDFPRGIRVNVKCSIKNVYENPGTISYMEVRVDFCDIKMRNIVVK